MLAGHLTSGSVIKTLFQGNKTESNRVGYPTSSSDLCMHMGTCAPHLHLYIHPPTHTHTIHAYTTHTQTNTKTFELSPGMIFSLCLPRFRLPYYFSPNHLFFKATSLTALIGYSSSQSLFRACCTLPTPCGLAQLLPVSSFPRIAI